MVDIAGFCVFSLLCNLFNLHLINTTIRFFMLIAVNRSSCIPNGEYKLSCD